MKRPLNVLSVGGRAPAPPFKIKQTLLDEVLVRVRATVRSIAAVDLHLVQRTVDIKLQKLTTGFLRVLAKFKPSLVGFTVLSCMCSDVVNNK